MPRHTVLRVRRGAHRPSCAAPPVELSRRVRRLRNQLLRSEGAAKPRYPANCNRCGMRFGLQLRGRAMDCEGMDGKIKACPLFVPWQVLVFVVVPSRRSSASPVIASCTHLITHQRYVAAVWEGRERARKAQAVGGEEMSSPSMLGCCVFSCAAR